ncbi:DNA-directed RNA polymerase III subunit RPC4-like isoform X1 [Panicum miliaceum]|uniref:DNA-directed RNA polymerase III subunit RPC4-like isoform X1 n=1 Tax=Panicum miliaceum TaxID=4540 RepID=A0A3L6TFQ7_PANMI|nr:DNA-directed RNA polymerase III subunit RPC4-like isoform X1 [Panicum miliaceum]
MDADSSSKRSRPVRRAVKKLKFKPKVPPQKPKKLTTEKPQQEEPKPINEQLMKILRTRQVPGNTAPNTKDERSTQKPPSTPPSADVVSLLPAQSGVHKQNQSVNPGAESRMPQHVVALNTREKHCCLLGEIENRHVIVTPDVDSLLNGK